MVRQSGTGIQSAWSALIVVAVLAGSWVPASLAEPRGEVFEDPSCNRHELEVRLVPRDITAFTLVGWLCGYQPQAGQTVLVTSPPGLTAHAYWDWPQDPDILSFVRYATGAGFAVFNYDRIGTGESDRPDTASVNVETEAYVLHQIVHALRDGTIGGTSFGRVVLVGNSLSVFISVTEAATFQDVDGVINTGVWVGPHPEGLVELFATFHPAQNDPKFADDPSIPPGYATTVPGSRETFFYLPEADEDVLALDEALKDTATLGEAATFPSWSLVTQRVDVPVLSVMGDRDFLFCRPVCHADGPEAQRESLFWAPEACVEVVLVRDAGHSVQLHRNAAGNFHALAGDWLDRRVGAHVALDPPSHPCLA